MKNIGITGASGQLGIGLVRHTLARHPAAEIVAITRNPAKLKQFSGIQTRSGDFSQPAGLEAAFHGIERLVIIPTGDLQPGVRIRQHSDAIDAAVRAGVRHVIYICPSRLLKKLAHATHGCPEKDFVSRFALARRPVGVRSAPRCRVSGSG